MLFDFWLELFFKTPEKKEHSFAFTGNAVFPLPVSQDKLKHLILTLAEPA